MTRTTRLFPAFALAALLIVPAEAAAPGQQQVDDLRRRVEAIEQRLFQQQLSQPVSPQGQAVQQLEMRLRQLETEIQSERVSRLAADVTSRKTDPAAAPKSIETRLAELEAQRAEDARTIAALTKRVAALEKPRAK